MRQTEVRTPWGSAAPLRLRHRGRRRKPLTIAVVQLRQLRHRLARHAVV